MSKKLNIKHSPGPWRWDEEGNALVDANDKLILELGLLAGQEGDDNLIVAAPALAQACWQARNVVKSWLIADDTPNKETLERCLNVLHNALLFAKWGEPPNEDIPDIFEDIQ